MKQHYHLKMFLYWACYLSTWEAEEEGSQVQGQPVLHRETLSQRIKQINKKDFMQEMAIKIMPFTQK
jgi:hypothetical protein